MKAIAVDDEIYMLETLQEAVSASTDVAQVEAFSSCSAALAYASENPIDIAFLDINMRGIGGLGLAEKLMDLHPDCKIIFCTGYQEYAVSAFQLHVAGYLMKPITPEAVQKEIDHIKGVKAAERRELALKSLQRVGLEDRADKYPAQLSGGQQQRVSIARALAGDPPVILADEPTGALDSKTGREVLEFLKQLNKEGTTIILITHDNSIAEEIRRVVRIHDGKIISDEVKEVSA